jgi:polar amino acid transport system substrate-binding protein
LLLKKLRNQALSVHLLITLLLLCVNGLAWAEDVDVFAAEDYPKVSFLKDGKPAGVFPEVLAAVSPYSGDRYVLHLMPWKRAQAMAARGLGGVAHFSWTQERAAVFDYSDPVLGDEIQLVVVKGQEFVYRSPADLRGKRVGAKLGASFGQQIDEQFSQGSFSVDRDLSAGSRLRKLLRGRIDVAVIEGIHGDLRPLARAEAMNDGDLAQLVVLVQPLVNDQLHLAFAKSGNWQAVLQRFNHGLAQLKNTDAYQAILRAN